MTSTSPKELTLDQQQKLESLRHHLPAMHSLLLQRSSLLPVVAMLCVAVLVVFSLDRSLLPIEDGELRVLITVLLGLIPISLLFHLAENHSGIQNTYKAVKEIVGEVIEEPKNPFKRVGRIIQAYHAWILVSVLSLIIGYVIWVLWR